MPRRYAIWGLVVLVFAAGGGWAWRASAGRTARPQVAVTSATRGEFVVSLPVEGTLQSDDSVTVSTGKAPGELTMIVPDGTVVRAGEVFCRIEARELLRKQADAELADEQAQEEINNARESAQERYENDQRVAEQAEKDFKVWEESVGARTKQAEDKLAFDRVEAERLRLEYERDQRMADKGYQAAAEADIAKAAYEAQQFKVEQSIKGLELSRREVEAERRQKQVQLAAGQRRVVISQGRIQQMVAYAERSAEVAAKQLQTIVSALADTTILAPTSGTVSLFSTFRGGERRSWREGDQVSTGTPLGSISGSENMSVRCRVKEANVGALHLGQEAQIQFDALPGRTFAGVVSSVGVVAREVWMWEDPTAEANERVFDVLVKVKQTSGGAPPAASGLKPGLNARANIILKRLPNRLSVALEAVLERDGRSYVYVKQGDDRGRLTAFVRRQVQIGERNDVAVVVRKGLAGGEVVALSAAGGARPATRSQAGKAR